MTLLSRQIGRLANLPPAKTHAVMFENKSSACRVYLLLLLTFDETRCIKGSERCVQFTLQLTL